MQERRHVKTVPGEPNAAPELVPHPVRREEGGNVQMDDINIPLVATVVAFFAVFLAVAIVSLQAWVYHYQAWEQASKTLPQEDPKTQLGAILAAQRADLHAPAGPVLHVEATAATKAAGSTQAVKPPVKMRIPIDQAMRIVAEDYAKGTR